MIPDQVLVDRESPPSSAWTATAAVAIASPMQELEHWLYAVHHDRRCRRPHLYDPAHHTQPHCHGGLEMRVVGVRSSQGWWCFDDAARNRGVMEMVVVAAELPAWGGLPV
jgi:hypothetical protein